MGQSGSVAYTTPVMTGSSIIGPSLIPLGSSPSGTFCSFGTLLPLSRT